MSSKQLAAYFRAQSKWRERKVEKHPEDRRNAQSAAALRALADFVGGTDWQTEHAVDLEAHLSADELELGGQRAQRTVGRYGYGYGVVARSHEAFLEELLALCLHDAYESVSENASGLDPTGSLHDFEIAAALDGIVLDGGYWMRRAQGRMSINELTEWVLEIRADDCEHAVAPSDSASLERSPRMVTSHKGGAK